MGDTEVDFLVSTQSLESGGALVTAALDEGDPPAISLADPQSMKRVPARSKTSRLSVFLATRAS